MSAPASRWFCPLLVALSGSVLVASCDGNGSGSAPSPPGVGGATGGGGSSTVAPNTPVPIPEPNGTGGVASLNPLCGAGDCVPDDPSSCDEGQPPPEPGPELGGMAGEGGAGGAASGGTASGGMASGGRAGGAGGTGGSQAGSGAGGAGGSISAGGAAGENTGGIAAPSACRVVAVEGKPSSSCAVAGTGELDAPCFSTNDCGAGFACVGDGLVGRCRPLCCRGDASCQSLPGTYCSVEPQRETDQEEAVEKPLEVPVCIAADDCDLGEPYPCPAGSVCDCGEGEACLVVRSDRGSNQSGSGLGTTACARPGEGRLKDPCPCAWGHICSQATGTCLLLCSTVAEEGDCVGRCQASSELPPGFGVCLVK